MAQPIGPPRPGCEEVRPDRAEGASRSTNCATAVLPACNALIPNQNEKFNIMKTSFKESADSRRANGPKTKSWSLGHAVWPTVLLAHHGLSMSVGILLAATAFAASPQIKPSASLQHQAITLGKSVRFAVTASGIEPLAYQWWRDGDLLPGQTNNALNMSSVQPADEGDYTVVVSNPDGTAASIPARLWVVPPSSAFTQRNYTNAAGFRVPYAYLMPTNYVPTNSYPLVCFYVGVPDFYGYEDQYGLYSDQNFHMQKVFASYRQQVENPAVVVWLTRRKGEGSWTATYVAQVQELVEHLITQFNIDPNRVYAVGGYDAVPVIMDTIGLRPDVFAGAILFTDHGTSKTPPDTIKYISIWNLHSATDDTANVSNSRQLMQALREAGGHPIYTEFANAPHLDSIYMELCIPALVDWLPKQRRGVAATEPMLSITNPTQEAFHTTGAASLDLTGSAQAMSENITRVAWENITSKTTGEASGTNLWSATGIPLLAEKTNVIIVTATTTSWAPAYGGSTTFNRTLFVVSTPLRALLTLQAPGAVLDWTGGAAPYSVQRATDLGNGDWADLLTNALPPLTLPLDGTAGFYRVLGQ